MSSKTTITQYNDTKQHRNMSNDILFVYVDNGIASVIE